MTCQSPAAQNRGNRDSRYQKRIPACTRQWSVAAVMSASTVGTSQAAPTSRSVLDTYVTTIRRAARATSPFPTAMISRNEAATARNASNASPGA